MNTSKENRDRERFFDFVVSSVPRIEAPFFFAERVANAAQVERNSFAGLLQAFSRRLVPIFMTLMVLVCFAVHQWRTPDPLAESMMFYDEEQLAENITVEFVVSSLALPLDEQNENH